MKFVKDNIIFIILIVAIIIVFLLLISTPEEKKLNSQSLTIIGDSRMVGLCSYSWFKETKEVCIAKTAIGYNWFINTAIAAVDRVEEYKRANIAINLGVNDLYNVNNYINKYKELAANQWKSSRIFVVSVNPTKGSYDKLNSQIDQFNEKMKSAFKEYDNIIYCDTNSYLKENGFETSDGLHYNNSTSKKIYEQIKKCIY